MAVSSQSDNDVVKPPMTPPTQANVNATPQAAPIQPGPAQMQPTAPTPTQQSTTTPTLAPAAPSAPGASPTPAAGTPTGVGVAGIQPGQDLRNSSVLPTDAVDRYKLAQDRQATYLNAQEPVTRAASRSIYQDAASRGMAGPGGAGELRTSLGNLGLEEDRDARNNLSNLLSNATEGTIQDAANNRNEYRQERGYQNGLENQGYERGVQGLQLEDSLTNSAFGRGLATSQFGASGNPGATQLGLAGMYGQQASDAGNSVGQMVSQNASNGILSSIYGQPQKKSGIMPGDQQTPQYSPQNNILTSIYGDG